MANILNLGLSAVATGVDTITATYSPAITLTDRRIVYLRTAGTNATTTPTFNPNGLGAQTITKGGGSALAVGDLDGDVILMYDLTNTNWELLTPKTGTIPTLAQVLDAGYLTGESGIYSDNALNYLLLLNAYIAMGFDDGLGALANLSLTATESQINFLNNVASGFFKVTETESGIQHDVKVKIDTPNVELTQETASLILSTDASKNIKGLSTTTYPSFTELAHVKGVTSAIQTQLNNCVRIIHKTTTGGTTVTGTTANTISYSVLIPANTFTVGDFPRVNLQARFTGTAGIKNVRIYFNTTDNLTTPDLIGTFPTPATNLALTMSRMFAIKSTTDTEVNNNTSTSTGADFNTTLAASSLNIDWTVGQYLIIAIQLVNSADSGVVSSVKLTN